MYKRIVIRETNWIGDAIMTLPAVELVAMACPDSEIWIAARPWVAPLFHTIPFVKQVIPLAGKGGRGGLLPLYKDISQLRKHDFDLGLLFPNSFESALGMLLSGVHERVGYRRDLRRLLLSSSFLVPADKEKRHHIFYYLNLVSSFFGIEMPDHPVLYLQASPHAKASAMEICRGQRLLDGDGPLIGFNPGAAYGPAKCWPLERYVALGKLLLSAYPGARIVILGTGKEAGQFQQMAEAIGPAARSLAGMTSLQEVVAVVEMLDLLVTNDSGLMHIGAATATPLVAIFGSTNPVATGPWSKKAKIVTNPVECAPCLKRTCSSNFECMLGITPEMVFLSAEELIAQTVTDSGRDSR